mgnify:FL=1
MPKRENLQRKLEQAQRKGDAKRIAEHEAELSLPEFPRELGYLWRVYHRIRRRMAGGFAAPNPIGWQEIDAFVRQTKFRLAPWEIELLETIDDAFLQPQLAALKDKVKKPGAASTELVDSSDTKSVRNLMRSIGKRRSGKGKAKENV